MPFISALASIASTILQNSLARSGKRLTQDPIPGFFFEVGVSYGGIVVNSPFTEVQGLNIGSDEPESKIEVGANIPITLPKGLRTDKLVLKRYVRPMHIGGVAGSSQDVFTRWCKNSMDIYKNWDKSLEVKDIVVKVLHPHLKSAAGTFVPVVVFNVERAYPITWEISDLNSTNAEEPLIETITLAYQEMKREMSLSIGVS